MGLVPIAASPLRAKAARRGKVLTVTDPSGAAVVEATENKAADRLEVTIETAAGSWRIEEAVPLHRLGRILATVRTPSEVAILDPAGNPVAVARNGEVVLAGGEALSWRQSRAPTRYRLGDDLWVAKDSWRSGTVFSAELSEQMLARPDRSLLVGVASILTQHASTRRDRMLGAASNLGAAGG
jgi:hypothetical protein